jgi:predicted molibdopterin-dependent oxidoreductase YjgC
LLAFTVDSEPCVAHPGDTVAAALYASGRRAWGRSRTGDMRGLFCGIGVCYECLVTVDGVPNQRACQVEIRNGMVVRTDLEELPKP